jgi:hypothetical protein
MRIIDVTMAAPCRRLLAVWGFGTIDHGRILAFFPAFDNQPMFFAARFLKKGGITDAEQQVFSIIKHIFAGCCLQINGLSSTIQGILRPSLSVEKYRLEISAGK